MYELDVGNKSYEISPLNKETPKEILYSHHWKNILHASHKNPSVRVASTTPPHWRNKTKLLRELLSVLKQGLHLPAHAEGLPRAIPAPFPAPCSCLGRGTGQPESPGSAGAWGPAPERGENCLGTKDPHIPHHAPFPAPLTLLSLTWVPLWVVCALKPN